MTEKNNNFCIKQLKIFKDFVVTHKNSHFNLAYIVGSKNHISGEWLACSP